MPVAQPPITVGELTDVPAPESEIRAAWAQKVSNRVVHRFGTTAAMAASNLIDSSVATVGGVLYERVAGTWREILYGSNFTNTGSGASAGLLLDVTGLGGNPGTWTWRANRQGRMIDFRYYHTFGSAGPSFGANPRLTLPWACVDLLTITADLFLAPQGATFKGIAKLSTTTQLLLYATGNGSGQPGSITSTYPFSWGGANSTILANVRYEADTLFPF